MKKAFTMMEIVFVIVIVGILSALLMPNFTRDDARLAAIQLLSDIRYTQHLALIDDKYNPSDNQWYKGYWQLLFGTSADTGGYIAYSIFSDSPSYSGNPGISELAKNPQDSSKLMSGGYSGVLNFQTDSRVTKKMNLGYSYHITDVNTSNCGGAKRIAFDYLGRPHIGNSSAWASPLDGLLKQPCDFIIKTAKESVTIRIQPITGYACILDKNGNCI